MVFVLTLIHSSRSSYPSSAGEHKLILHHSVGNLGKFYKLSQHPSVACLDIQQ